MSVSVASMIPSMLISLLLIGLWLDYALGALRAYSKTHSRGVFREYVVSLVILASVFAQAVGVLFAWLPPGEPDPVVIGILSGLRAVMLPVGVWLAWDRRRTP